MLVELKNGETLNGHLVTCDTWMNLTLKEVVQTSSVCSPLKTRARAERSGREGMMTEAGGREEKANLVGVIGWR
jgi:small nuclear ribonucleoprotein (snRNP)-like protein